MMNFKLDHFLEEAPAGWHELIRDTHNRILKVDPEYQIFQIKEKFGGLRYYYDASRSHAIPEIDKIIKTAEVVASVVCQNCGELGASLTVNNGWYATLCEKHIAEWSKK